MSFRIQLRRDSSEKWSANNPVLFQGEAGYETDTNYLKIGNGITPWNDLPYFMGGGDLENTINQLQTQIADINQKLQNNNIN